MEVMYWQLKQGLKEEGTSPAGPFLDESWLAEDMFLHFHMKVFFSSLKAALSVDGALLYQARRLKKLVETVLGWSLETETEFNLDDEVGTATYNWNSYRLKTCIQKALVPAEG
jgi:hypothetical protein